MPPLHWCFLGLRQPWRKVERKGDFKQANIDSSFSLISLSSTSSSSSFHLFFFFFLFHLGVDPQFCPSTLTYYPMDVTLTHRSHMAPLGPHLTLVGFRASSGLVCGPLSVYVVHFEVSSWRFFFYWHHAIGSKWGPPKF